MSVKKNVATGVKAVALCLCLVHFWSVHAATKAMQTVTARNGQTCQAAIYGALFRADIEQTQVQWGGACRNGVASGEGFVTIPSGSSGAKLEWYGLMNDGIPNGLWLKSRVSSNGRETNVGVATLSSEGKTGSTSFDVPRDKSEQVRENLARFKDELNGTPTVDLRKLDAAMYASGQHILRRS